jgi:nucleoside-diphosphate-sugar epimerase
MSIALVTGSAGFVGRHFTAHLRERGWKVQAIDIRDNGDALDVFRDRSDAVSYDLVIHAAAVVGGRQVIEADPMAQAVNFELDAAMFRWALRTRPGRVVYFSSSAAYPVHLQNRGTGRRLDEHDIRLDEPCGPPDQLYGWSKRTGEYLATRAREYGLPVTVVRPFSGYGEDQDACYPFPAFIDRALRREDPFLVWGDGSQVRDFIHIDDIVAAVMAMYEKDANGPVNLGSGQPVSMRQLAALVCAEAGYSPEIESVPSAPSGVGYRVACPTKMYSYHGPKVTLQQGIRRALEYRRGLLPGSGYQEHGIR